MQPLPSPLTSTADGAQCARQVASRLQARCHSGCAVCGCTDDAIPDLLHFFGWETAPAEAAVDPGSEICHFGQRISRLQDVGDRARGDGWNHEAVGPLQELWRAQRGCRQTDESARTILRHVPPDATCL